jgi:hypothetical protein
MPTTIPEDDRVNRFIDWLYGKEGQVDATGATARFVQGHVHRRPAVGGAARWGTIEGMKYFAMTNGPACTPTQIDAAVTAWGG